VGLVRDREECGGPIAIPFKIYKSWQLAHMLLDRMVGTHAL
jgi:hypothetical protein